MPVKRKDEVLPFLAEPGGVVEVCDPDRVAGVADVAPCRADLSPAAVDEVAERFRVLGEPLRVRLIQELQDGERTVSDLVAALGATQSNVSKHLRIIQAAGIAGRRHAGNLVYYFMTDPSVFALCDAVCASVGERLTRDARIAAELNRSGNRRR